MIRSVAIIKTQQVENTVMHSLFVPVVYFCATINVEMMATKILIKTINRRYTQNLIHSFSVQRSSLQNSIAKRFYSKDFQKEEENILTLNEILELSPLDVEKELHKSRRKLARLFKMANYPAALECAQDMEIKVTTIMGKKNVVYASCLNNLALAQKMSGNLPEALDNYLFSLEIYFELLGKKHLNYAVALSNAGMLYKEIAETATGLDKLNAMERGEEALVDALAIRQELGKTHA